MKKLVSETLNEFWTSSDSGLGNFDISYASKEDIDNSNDLSSAVPPPTIKLTIEEFDHYVNELIQMIPEDPNLAFALLKETIKNHPYLNRKPAGFKGENLYKPIIEKFIQAIRSIAHQA